MINNISWGSYWSVLSIVLIFYYVYVLWNYFGKDVFRTFAGRRPVAGSPQGSSAEIIQNEFPPEVQSLTTEMSAYLEQASYAKAEKEEIIFGLQQIVKKYPGIKFNNYRPAINNLIVSEWEEKCAVHLSEAETRQVWLV